MKTSNDFYWRKDGLSWTSGPHIDLPKNDPMFKVSYHYLRSDYPGVKYKRTEVSPLIFKGKIVLSKVVAH